MRWPALGLLLVLVARAAVPSAIAATPVDEPRPIPPGAWIIETDMGIDDWLAVLVLLKSPGQRVLGIATSGVGHASCAHAPANALRLLQLVGRAGEIPVTCGPPDAAAHQPALPLPWREAADALPGAMLGPAPGEPDPRASADLIRDLLRRADGPVNILALGPLTNLAAALAAEPALAGKIETLVVKGGAVDVPGNLIVPGFTDTLANQVAEWNIYLDPAAAGAVFASGVPILLVPLDATMQAPLDYAWLEGFAASAETPEAVFTRDLLTRMLDPDEAGTFDLGDALAALIAVDRQLCSYVILPIEILTEPLEVAGETSMSATGRWVTTCLAPDVPAALALFAERMNAPD